MATSAAINRAVVPELPTKISLGCSAEPPGTIKPSGPETTIERFPGSCGSNDQEISMPSERRHFTMISVSSLQSAAFRVVLAADKAASSNARLVMLLEPGTAISACTGPERGKISNKTGLDTG